MSKYTLPVLLLLLVATRFVGLSWGFPFLMHPDERNMATAISNLSLSDGFNPHFFAYGQLPLYIVWAFYAALSLTLQPAIDPAQAVFGLRVFSALLSVACGWVMYKLLFRDTKSNEIAVTGLLLWIVTPVWIQFAHFGTTETLLAFLMLCLLWYRKDFFMSGIIIGLSMGTKVSSFILFAIPVNELLTNLYHHKKTVVKTIIDALTVVVISVIWTFVASPHYMLSLKETIHTLTYETRVATGLEKVFYTYQFEHIGNTFLYPFTSIFPYALGIPLLFLVISQLRYVFKQHRIYLLLLIIFFLFLMQVYTQWTRFYVYVFVLAVIIASFAGRRLAQHNKQIFLKYAYALIIMVQIIVGLSYIAVYLQPDTRIEASLWIKNNVPSGSVLLTESANVILVPFVSPPQSRVVELFLFESERDRAVMQELKNTMNTADYVVVPTRRIFANYSCLYNRGPHTKSVCEALKKEHITLHRYYSELLSDKWKEVARFESKHLGLSDEFAEETWTVFDHPVVRIYKKM